MGAITSEKLDQAVGIVADSDVDVWLTFVRETAGGGDPILPLLIDGGLTWQSALLITKGGKRVAVVGNYDADPLKASGEWHEVIPYVKGIREPLIAALEAYAPNAAPRIAVNFSTNDVKADGLTHGMYMLLQKHLEGTRFGGSLVSAEPILMALRGRKTASEIAAMKSAIAETDALFAEIDKFAAVGRSEREVYDHVQRLIRAKSLGYAWDPAGDPIVNSGPDSMIGHGIPSPSITLSPGHIFHIDLGVIKSGYSSDIQRCWYVPESGEKRIPADVERAFSAVHEAISVGADRLRPGVEGWEVDAAARASLVASGYSEYLHAFGHQVGRMAHDGGAILGPKWERYGKTPTIPVHDGEVYTLELGVILENRGYLGLEEMVVVRPGGVEWLTTRQDELPFVR